MIDDRSRYLVALALCPDQTMAAASAAPWDAFGTACLPEATLSDNGFAPGARRPAGGRGRRPGWSGWGVQALDGRPYHPQTQGKVERPHRTLERELLPRPDWSRPEAEAAAALGRWAREVYTAVRPHEALGHATPASVWYASGPLRPGRRPAARPGRPGGR